MKMGPLVLVGLILVAFGVLALTIPSYTYFTTERVADVGLFKIDVSKPHTIVFNPVVGGIVLALGIAALIVGLRASSRKSEQQRR